MDWVSFHGRGLHSGAPCSLRLSRTPGPICFETERGCATRADLRIARTDHGVKVTAPSFGFELDLVEHLLAGLAGLGVQSGIRIRSSGPEVPLQDGAALEFALAISALGASPGPPELRVAAPGRLSVGSSVYEFFPGPKPALAVTVEFGTRGRETAEWDGSAAQFLDEIAGARTFGFRADAPRLHAAGRATFVDPLAVIILESDGNTSPPAEPPRKNELARHKLLDLLGDLYLNGGPPLGLVRALRPGHTASQRAIELALARKILERT